MNFPTTLYTQLTYLLRQDISKLYISVAIRNFAIGMVTLFEPIYIYLFFEESLAPTLFYFAVIWGLYALLAVWGGRIVAFLGPARSMLVSFFLYVGYYGVLLLFPVSFLYVAAAVVLGAAGMLFFWPAFQVDFTRFSSAEHRGRSVGGKGLMFLPLVAGPFAGGVILTGLGYPGLFTTVLVVLAVAAIPLFYATEQKETYRDTFKSAWQRVLAKTSWRETAGYAANGIEINVNYYIWPLYLFLIAVSFSEMGALTSAALVASSLFMLYMGRVSDTEDRSWLLNVGALWTALSWGLKFFVRTPFDALLAHVVYRTSRAAAGVPFQTLFYEKAAERDKEADEYIIYREIVVNGSRALFFAGLGAALLAVPGLELNAAFIAAALLSLAFVLLGKVPRIKLRTII